ncbi:MAG: metalloregulator ArsR/SmtB family transcription factor [Gammaproteobacteria bacterium]|nr:metalloregulator ArsR/SmtB family transcription factor [Gammaproteobacteria bacterium]
MEALLTSLRAAGESTRLRLLNILSRCELTVSELTHILLHSQPRISRHLKLMCEAGLLHRAQEGAWVFYRLADHGTGARLAQSLLRLLPEKDEQLRRDVKRLDDVRRQRADAAAAYFREVASTWDRLRQLYVAESEVERAMLEAVGEEPVENLLDLGTGTGRILQVFGDRIRHGLGIDSSREMLAVARSKLEEKNLRHCQVRLGDIFSLPVPTGAMDVVTIHHVLHFLDDPAGAVAEAARALRPSGQLLIVDFARHSLEFLREDYSHRRLGFSDREVFAWGKAAGLVQPSVRKLRAGTEAGKKLTACLWTFRQNRNAPSHIRLEVA